MRISDWSSDVCSSDLAPLHQVADLHVAGHHLAVAQHVAAAAVIADPATGFAHQQDAGGDIPRLASGFEIGIGAATSDIGHVEGSEDLRVGKDWVSTGRTRGGPYL